ncbi:hypothetical protein B0H16DRAFT_1553223, partial [Mycena metata]
TLMALPIVHLCIPPALQVDKLYSSPLLSLCIGKSTMVGSHISPQNCSFGSQCLLGLDCGLPTIHLLLAENKPCSRMTSLYVAQTGQSVIIPR